MRTGILAAFGVVLASTSAFSADLAQPSYDWSGGYIGLNGGYAFGDADFVEVSGSYNGTGTTSSNSADGFTGGIQAGWNQQFNSIVLGLELEGGWLGANGSDVGFGSSDTFSSVDAGLYGTAALRAGFAVDRALFFVKGGGALADINAEVNDSDPGGNMIHASDSGAELGWTLGGGVEFAISDTVTAKLEYAHYRFNDISVSGDGIIVPGTVKWSSDVDIDTVKVGLNWRF
ncbi:outer membrane protein [Aestuariivirga sp.]|uniref:outer membrane protein n=1 Tax=Aestuariivirga sp. TaxID=2650926 RepID=UPI0039E64A87